MCCKTGTPAKCKTKTSGWPAAKGYDYSKAESYCVGETCDASNAVEVATCTKTVGVCTFFNTGGTAPKCGTDKVYDSSKATGKCVADPCVKTNADDLAMCCKTGTPAKCK